MHPSVMRFVGQAIHRYGLLGRPVLEIGSLDVNGSVRHLFGSRVYVGTDMRPGKGVDRVVNAHDLTPTTVGTFGVVVCCEMLEHDDKPWATLLSASKCVWEGGYLILTVRGFDQRGAFHLHGYPEDYWRFTTVGMDRLLRECEWQPLELHDDPEAPGVFAVARKAA